MKIISGIALVLGGLFRLALAAASLLFGVVAIGLLIDLALADVGPAPSIFVEVTTLHDAALVLLSASVSLFLAFQVSKTVAAGE